VLLLAIEPKLLGCPARSLVTTPNTVLRLPYTSSQLKSVTTRNTGNNLNLNETKSTG
jgi:hypothetical protein